MSDQSISIVPKQSVYPAKETKVKEIVDWLASLDIIKPAISDCVLNANGGHAISEGAKFVVTEPEYLPFDFSINGLEVIIDRLVFHTGQNGIEQLICPACKEDIANEDWFFLNEWAGNESNNLTCPLCKVGTEIHQFSFAPQWGFSDLGFSFWNWPGFTESFIKDFKQKLECDVDIVYTHF